MSKYSVCAIDTKRNSVVSTKTQEECRMVAGKFQFPNAIIRNLSFVSQTVPVPATLSGRMCCLRAKSPSNWSQRRSAPMESLPHPPMDLAGVFNPYSKKHYLQIRTLLPNFYSNLQQTNFPASLISSVFFIFFCRINKSLVLLDGGLLGTPIS